MKKGTKGFKRYTERFKQQVVIEVLSGESSKSFVNRKYGISGSTTLARWCRRYGGESYEASHLIDLPLSMRPATGTEKEPLPDDVKLLRQRIAELETQLAVESLKREAFERFVEIAKREYDLDLTKKFDTKQSPK